MRTIEINIWIMIVKIILRKYSKYQQDTNKLKNTLMNWKVNQDTTTMHNRQRRSTKIKLKQQTVNNIKINLNQQKKVTKRDYTIIRNNTNKNNI